MSIYDASAILSIALFVGPAIQGQQSSGTVQHDSGKLRVCRELDADIYPPETCSAILSYLSPSDSIGPVFEDGSFVVESPLPDGKIDWKTYFLSPSLRSAIALNSVRNTIRSAEIAGAGEPNNLLTAMIPQGRELWSKLRDVYCYYRPGATYEDLSRGKVECLTVTSLPDEKTLEREFSGAAIFQTNYVTFCLAAETTAMTSKQSQSAGSVSNLSPQGSQSADRSTPDQGISTLSWSSRSCSICESSILNQGWYSDGSGLFTEVIHGKVATVMVGVALIDGNLVVALGFGITGDGNLTFSPTAAVQLETNSAPRMVLYPLAHPGPRIPKDDVSVKKQFKTKPVMLKSGGSTAGYLFFPNDDNASHVTVVVVLGQETFRCPFARNPNALAKFIDADVLSAPFRGQR
jgi:hypothetical protein